MTNWQVRVEHFATKVQHEVIPISDSVLIESREGVRKKFSGEKDRRRKSLLRNILYDIDNLLGLYHG